MPVITPVLQSPIWPALSHPLAQRADLDPDAALWYNNVVAAGGAGEWGATATARSLNRKALDTLVRGLKAASLWTGLKIRLFAGTNTLAGGLASGVGGVITNNGFVSADVNIFGGWRGDGSKRLTSNWLGNEFGQDNFATWCWVTRPAAAVAQSYFGNTNSATAGSQSLNWNTATTWGARAKMTVSSAPAGDPATTTGFVGISRITSTDFIFRAVQSNQTIAAASTGNGSASLDFFARGSGQLADCAISAFGTGPGLTPTQLATLDSLLTAYHDSIYNEFDNTYLQPDGVSRYLQPDGISTYKQR